VKENPCSSLLYYTVVNENIMNVIYQSKTIVENVWHTWKSTSSITHDSGLRARIAVCWTPKFKCWISSSRNECRHIVWWREYLIIQIIVKPVLIFWSHFFKTFFV